MEINIFLSKHLENTEFLSFSNTLILIRVPYSFCRTQSVSGLQLKTSEQLYNVDHSSFLISDIISQNCLHKRGDYISENLLMLCFLTSKPTHKLLEFQSEKTFPLAISLFLSIWIAVCNKCDYTFNKSSMLASLKVFRVTPKKAYEAFTDCGTSSTGSYRHGLINRMPYEREWSTFYSYTKRPSFEDRKTAEEP